MESVAGILLVLAFIALYFAPSFIASLRKHHNGVAIFAVNLLLGWTFLGWVAALVWSLRVMQPNAGKSERRPCRAGVCTSPAFAPPMTLGRCR